MSEQTIYRIISPVIIAAYMLWSAVGTILYYTAPVWVPVAIFMFPKEVLDNPNHPYLWTFGGTVLFMKLYLWIDPQMREKRMREEEVYVCRNDDNQDIDDGYGYNDDAAPWHINKFMVSDFYDWESDFYD